MQMYLADVLRRDGARVYAEFLGKASGIALSSVIIASTLPQMLLIAPFSQFLRAYIAGAHIVQFLCELSLDTSHSVLSDTAQL